MHSSSGTTPPSEVALLDIPRNIKSNSTCHSHLKQLVIPYYTQFVMLCKCTMATQQLNHIWHAINKTIRVKGLGRPY